MLARPEKHAVLLLEGPHSGEAIGLKGARWMMNVNKVLALICWITDIDMPPASH